MKSQLSRSLSRTLLLVPSVAMAFAFATEAKSLAQAISPVINEYRGTAFSGSFDVSNDSLTPMVVTLEAKSFTIDADGKGWYRPLDASVHLSLSDKSLRLPPRSRRTVLYKASADAYPAWFSVYASFHGLPRQQGVNVVLELPHTVYLLGDRNQSKVRNDDVSFSNLRVEGSLLRGTMKNVSPRMLRVASLEASQPAHGKVNVGGFPLLPGGVRDFELRLNAADVAAELVAHFGEYGANTARAQARPSAADSLPSATVLRASVE